MFLVSLAGSSLYCVRSNIICRKRRLNISSSDSWWVLCLGQRSTICIQHILSTGVLFLGVHALVIGCALTLDHLKAPRLKVGQVHDRAHPLLSTGAISTLRRLKMDHRVHPCLCPAVVCSQHNNPSNTHVLCTACFIYPGMICIVNPISPDFTLTLILRARKR